MVLSKNTMYIICAILIVAIALYVYYGQDSTKSEPLENTKDQVVSNLPPKVLKYFGGSHCPHSRKDSIPFHIINDFGDQYTSVTIEYYWSEDPDAGEEFAKAQADYVPTITNGDYKKITLGLPDSVDRTNTPPEELKNLLMANIYEQL
jgi:hypothetical protein